MIKFTDQSRFLGIVASFRRKHRLTRATRRITAPYGCAVKTYVGVGPYQAEGLAWRKRRVPARQTPRVFGRGM